jgi:phosphatidate cytidylyltransferase
MDDGSAVSVVYRRLRASNLFQRIRSALILLPFILFVVWLGEPFVSITVMVAAVLALYELYGIFQAGGYAPRRQSGYLSVVLFVLAAVFGAQTKTDWGGSALAVSIMVSLGWEVMRHDRDQQLLNWSLTLSGAAYVGWTLAHFVLLRDLAYPLVGGLFSLLRFDAGAAWVLIVFAITMASDTSAYFVGKQFGRHRLAPYVSPNKSVEGALGAVVAAMIAGALAVIMLGLPIGAGGGMLLGLIGSIAGQIGDLAESLIKRQVGVKDSGNLIPGHGGLLDRIDSLLFTAPVVYYLAVLLVR